MASLTSATKGNTPVGVECTQDDLHRLSEWVESSAFAKTACVAAACQSYVFTCEQAAEFLSLVNFDDDRLELLGAFKDRLLDPDLCNSILALFSDDPEDDDRVDAQEAIAEFTKAEIGIVAKFPIEDDGERSDNNMSELLSALGGASFADDKLAVLQTDVNKDPSPPPFLPGQLVSVLNTFGHSDDREAALDYFSGPKLIYPMSCEKIILVLEAFSFSDEKKSVLRKLKPYIEDAQNKLSIVVSFTFDSDKEEAEEILRDVLVDFKDPIVPEEQVQEALKAIGTCSSGYPWRKVPNGYRCAAGGHYCSQSSIDAYIALL